MIWSDNEEKKRSHDPLLEPIATTPNIFTATGLVEDLVQLPSSLTSQLSMQIYDVTYDDHVTSLIMVM